MANRPPLDSVSSHGSDSTAYGDPFADRPRQAQFVEPERPYRNNNPQAFESSASIPQEFGGRDYNDEEDYMEKQPLTAGQTYPGGFYPPYVRVRLSIFLR